MTNITVCTTCMQISSKFLRYAKVLLKKISRLNECGCVTRGRFFCHGLLRSHEIAIAPIPRGKRTVPLS
ncbi:MAG: hypothetical protein II670_13155, partial [Alphaproteobacteria bacterium]|nr:hypothetical protein [Alphaproteobacteria bacterium]